jgi:hypothetical protein
MAEFFAPEYRRLHWPDVDEDVTTEGLLKGAPAPRAAR